MILGRVYSSRASILEAHPNLQRSVDQDTADYIYTDEKVLIKPDQVLGEICLRAGSCLNEAWHTNQDAATGLLLVFKVQLFAFECHCLL